jgi:MFS family permease
MYPRTTTATRAAETAGPATRGHPAAALLSVCLGFFVIQLDVTIMNVALPAIQRQIGGSLAGLQWVIDAYTLALASIMLTAGSAADRAGARKVFVLGLGGSLLCLSLFLQQTRHESVLATGLLLLPMSLVVGAGALASGPLTARLGPRPSMIAGFTLGAAGAAVLATAGPATPLSLLVGGSLLLGLVSLAMPAMTAAVLGAVGPGHAGVASGILNAARQSGGALGVAVLGSLLGGAPDLHVPLLVASFGYLIAVVLAWTTVRGASHRGAG